MIASERTLSQRLAKLRESFDHAFADPPPSPPLPTEDLLALTLGGHPHAIRARELRGLYVDRLVTPLPSPLVELVGLAAIRGELVAVYDLARLLGYEQPEAPRCLLLSTRRALAFAVDGVTGQLRVPLDALAERPAGNEPWLRQVMRDGPINRSIIELAAVCSLIEERVGAQSLEENS